MHIGRIIREYRKRKNMTQEQLANHLGVTAPAVNKWERGNSLPDITLLAPIARLLGISLDTLLSFHEDLTTEEINNILIEFKTKLKMSTYVEAFDFAKKTIKEYPNCHQLIWQLTLIIDSWSLENEDKSNYGDEILNWYLQALETDNEGIKTEVANSLYNFYMRKEEFENAEEYLSYFSDENPLKKEKQALIYSKTGRKEEAYLLYEQLLFTGYQTISMVLSGLYVLAQKEKDRDKASQLAKKQGQLANILEIGYYNEVSPMLDLAMSQQDVELTIDIMEKLIANIDTVDDFSKSSLYQHMSFKKMNKDFIEEQRQNLMTAFSDKETFEFMTDNERWQNLNKSNS